jgi:RNA polymerase sigma-70 factor (ECF subfamily)
LAGAELVSFSPLPNEERQGWRVLAEKMSTRAHNAAGNDLLPSAIPMSGSAQSAPARTRLAGLEPLVAELFERSGAARYGMSLPEFERVLNAIAVKYLPAEAALEETRESLVTLRVEELALARACAAGNERAWQDFLTKFREKLYDAALAITKDDATGRELADSLYADLYGTTARDGRRVSKLESYTGRGSLEGWLRTVLAQEFVNRYRKQRRLVSLEEKDEAGVQFAAAQPVAVVAVDARVEAATDEALALLSAEDRFVLAAYFLDGRTLAEIGRMLGVHESTVSRKLEKITAVLRKRIRSGLTARGMSKRQAEEALDADVRDVQVDVRARLAQESPPPAFSGGGERAGKNE